MAANAAIDVNTDAPRTIITTDPELDDLNSMLRVLLYSNEIDIVGLVYSASQHHWMGDPATGLAPKRWPEISPDTIYHIDQAINAYEKVQSNLRVHDARYPTAESLRDMTYWGNVKNIGEMAEDTDGSNFIKEILLDDEPGQVFLQAWGGPNTIARALKSIEDEYKGTPQWDAIYDKIVAKTVITSWGQQDTTFRDYIKPNWPDIHNREVSTSVWGYGSRGVVLPEHAVYHTPEWTAANVSTVGPMGAEYRVWGDGKQMAAGFDSEDYFALSGYTADELRAMGYGVWTPPQAKGGWISEGDSSNFALLMDNGLTSWAHPSWGGWGGRQAPNASGDPLQWANRGVRDIGPDGQPRNDYAAARWFEDFQLDYAARMQWTVTDDYDDANHQPDLTVTQGLDHTVRAGQSVTLSGTATDPDGDDVALKWWDYAEAGSYPGAAVIAPQTGSSATLEVPADAVPGETIHLILEGTDNGSPALTHYQRVVLTVGEPFTDVTWDNQFYNEISWLSAANISTGWDNGDGTRSYRPLANINRDAMAAFLYREAGSPTYVAPRVSPFTDVNTDNQFYKEISWLSTQGITTGWDNGDGTYSFRPLEPIARDAMAAFLYREAGNPAFEAPAASPFEDVTPATQFYKEITWMHGTGIATGWEGNDGRDYYRPLAPVARDAMAAFLYRATNPA
ncbi:Glycerol-3-phosphate ABC transporter, periplasmic glycerol-3-phosphate-binding protein [Serinibacter arcticus]|uniref:Glycerol-3-phosphate ABC transporter, periplasmic glycerol-3-phosphate-binding protein n=1 Tax=Serinibacter arcticus TaxID=1655435 RepID=A0A4Z1E616_9MICO|nr:Glycerol-3-phosphate ABC transporter, periplasmic glycerol-3-phosphate-binding protein [Serinibacter arcticus]